MSFLKSLGLVDDSDEKAVKKDDKPVKKSTAATQAPVVTPTPKTYLVGDHPASSNDPFKKSNTEDLGKFIEHFNKLLKDANLPGPDYYEFAQVLESDAMKNFDEKTKFSASYASLVSQGLTKEILVSSAKKYIEVIQSDKENFEETLKTKLDSEVGSRQSKIAELQEDIKQKTEQVAELTKAIADAQATIQTLNGEVEEVSGKIKSNETSFITAGESFVKTINSNIEKITFILG
jgi:uncharacterized protein YoxC